MEKEITCKETPYNTPTELVLETIAALSNTPIEELPPLYETVDPDALNQIFDHEHGQALQVQFQYNDHRITLDSEGTATFKEIN